MGVSVYRTWSVLQEGERKELNKSRSFLRKEKKTSLGEAKIEILEEDKRI